MFKKNIMLMGQTFKLAGDNQENMNAAASYLNACFEEVSKENPDLSFNAALVLSACRLAETLHILHKKHEFAESNRTSNDHMNQVLCNLLTYIDQNRA